MKKIVLIAPHEGSFYNFRRELIVKLCELGNDVTLICPYGSKIDFFISKGCHFFDISIDRRGTSLLKDAKLLLDYFQFLKRKRPDVVLTYTTKCSVYGGIVCRMLRIPYIVNNAGMIETDKSKIFLGWFLSLLYRIGFKGATCIMYQNTAERDSINKILRSKVHYRDIPGSGVNLSEFEYTPYPKSDEIRFNFVARIVKNKGVDEFLECAKKIKSEYSAVRFIMYGDYDDDIYREKVNELERQGIIEYGGVQLDMKPYIQSAHAIIHPSYYEGMTNVVLEHSACGRPCLGSNISGVKEGIDDGVTGFLFEVKNVESMVKKVKDFIELSYEKKCKMGERAREKMEKEFNREIVTKIYLEEIERI